MFALFGQSSFTLGLTPVVLDVVAAVLIWRIGRNLFGSNVGVGAALLFWIWPEVYIFDSTVEYGFRFATLVCGLAVMLLGIRICRRDEPIQLAYQANSADYERFGAVPSMSTSAAVRRFDWLALGLVAGIGWWGSPEIVYYLVPSGIFLGWGLLTRRVEFRPRLLGFAIFGAFVGALPWLWNNAKNRLGSLRHVPAQPDNSYTGHLATFVSHTMPMALGLRLRSTLVPGRQAYVPGSGTFFVAPSGPSWATVLGGTLYALVLIALLFWIVLLIRRRRALVLVGAVLLYPVLYALSPFAWDWSDGRYGLFLAPLLSLLVVSGGVAGFHRLSKDKLALPVAVLIGLALTLTAVAQLDPYTPVRSNPTRSGWLTWNSNPNPEAVYLTSSLESAHYRPRLGRLVTFLAPRMGVAWPHRCERRAVPDLPALLLLGGKRERSCLGVRGTSPGAVGRGPALDRRPDSESRLPDYQDQLLPGPHDF